MSHSIQLTISDINIYTNKCNEMKSKLDLISKYNNKHYVIDVNIIESLKKSINSTQSQFKESVDSDILTLLLSNLVTFEKQTANLLSLAQDSVSEQLVKILESSTFDFINYVKKYGVLVNEVVEYLSKNNIPVTNDNFEKYKDEVQQKALTQEKLNQYITNSFARIDQSEIKDEIKVILKKQIRSIISLEQLKDINAIILSKENDTKKVIYLSNKIIDSLKKQNFKPYGKVKWSYDEPNQNIIAKFSLQNDSGNVVQIIVDSSDHIKYKLGNYVGHACIKTTEKLIKDLISQGINVVHQVIHRDYEDGVQYMYMNKEKENNQ